MMWWQQLACRVHRDVCSCWDHQCSPLPSCSLNLTSCMLARLTQTDWMCKGILEASLFLHWTDSNVDCKQARQSVCIGQSCLPRTWNKRPAASLSTNLDVSWASYSLVIKQSSMAVSLSRLSRWPQPSNPEKMAKNRHCWLSCLDCLIKVKSGYLLSQDKQIWSIWPASC